MRQEGLQHLQLPNLPCPLFLMLFQAPDNLQELAFLLPQAQDDRTGHKHPDRPVPSPQEDTTFDEVSRTMSS